MIGLMNVYDALVNANMSPDFSLTPEQLGKIAGMVSVSGSGCWEWNGQRQKKKGYGRVRVGGRFVAAHRVTYKLLVGPLSDDRDLHHRHTCPKWCVNPGHLTPLAHEAHSVLHNPPGVLRPMTACCRQGHEWTPENTTVVSSGRLCLTCKRERERVRYRAFRSPTVRKYQKKTA